MDRRHFLWTGLALGTVASTGCGGVSGAESGSTPQVADKPSAPQPVLGTVDLPASTGSMEFTLVSPSDAEAAPFCLGYVFRQGDIATGQSVVASIPGVQVTPKSRWGDGSLRFAVVAGRATAKANQPVVISLSATEQVDARSLTLADLKATSITASVDCGSFGSALWASSDWDVPFLEWITGPQMSSWIYRKPVGNDPHLVAWLEIRLYAGGEVEVLPWIENGYLLVPGPTNKNATYTFSLGGTQRFSNAIDLPHHCRTPLVSGTSLSHWLGSDPGVFIQHDVGYLQASELVPSYRSNVSSSAAVVSALPASFAPLQQGGYATSMGQTGYHPAIGLLPVWDVLYLTCTTSAFPYFALQRNAYSAGRYPIHYRDETTNRPLRFSSYPHLSVNSSSTNQYAPKTSGTIPPAWDIPHHPSVGFLAYLVTGRWYFLEELQFAATFNFLAQVDTVRGYSGGVFVSSSGASTVRGAAWAVRTLAQAAVATPDADSPLHAEFLQSFSANVEFNHARYVAQPNNPFGVVQPYGDAYGTSTDGKVTEAPWQQDFYTAAFGYALAMQPGLPPDSLGKLSAFFAWKARSVIGRLGGTDSTEWLYRDAARYTFVVANVDLPDWVNGKGPWPADWGEMYSATYGAPNPGVPGDLRGAYFPDPTAYWGNLQPAIAYAVRHAVPGAATAYERMTGAENWGQMITKLNSSPVWGVRPARGS